MGGKLKKPWFWLILLVAALAGAYAYLGGFNPLQAERVGVSSYHLVGRTFDGSYRSDTIRQYFDEMRTLLQRQQLSEQPVVIIYDQEPQGSQGQIKNFIGIFTRNVTIDPDLRLQSRTISADSALRISKNCHPSLMPNPDKIAALIDKELGSASALTPNIELYYPNDRLIIERPF